MTCARCQELEEQIAYLKSELGLAQELDQLAKLRTRFGFTRQEGLFVSALYKAKGRTLHRDQLDGILPGERADDSLLKTFDVLISRIRKKCGFDFIETIWGHGWRLPSTSQRAIAEAWGESRAMAA